MAANKNKINYDDQFIKDNFEDYTLVELAKLLSDRIGQEVTSKNLSRHCIKIGLSKLTKDTEMEKLYKSNPELFIEIPDYNNYVMNKNNFKIYSKRQFVDKSLYLLDDGYYAYKMTGKHDYTDNVYYHILIAKLFIVNDDPKNKTQVNHIDGNKANNTIENLEWVTPKNNIIHARETNLNTSKPSDNDRLKESVIKSVYLDYKNDSSLSYNSLANKYNISPNSVKRIVTKERYTEITNLLD